MKRVMLLALTLCLLVPTTAAFAAEDGGWVLGAKAGYGWGSYDDNTSDTGTDTNATSTSFDDEDGWVGSVFVGYDWSDEGVDLRTELEYSMYHDADYEASNSTIAGAAKLNADIDIQTLMFNVYYDFENNTSFTPYLGLGAGLAIIDVDVDSDATYSNNAKVEGNMDATNFAWSASAGIAYEMTKNWDLDLQLRYVDFGSSGSIEEQNVNLEFDDLSSTDLMLGLRYTF